jgi:hypothetical protein
MYRVECGESESVLVLLNGMFSQLYTYTAASSKTLFNFFVIPHVSIDMDLHHHQAFIGNH